MLDGEWPASSVKYIAHQIGNDEGQIRVCVVYMHARVAGTNHQTGERLLRFQE